MKSPSPRSQGRNGERALPVPRFVFLVSCDDTFTHVTEQMFPFSCVYRSIPNFQVYCLQLLMSFMATMTARIAIRTTRMIRR